jgi:acyl-CoA reductase-like NAD-dependent aldehyde dehydrogenase
VLLTDVLEVRDPATGEVVGTAPVASPSDVEAAFARAVSALPAWRSDPGARVGALHAVADRIDGAVPELAALVTAEQGKPLRFAEREVRSAARWFRWFADLEVPEVVLRDDEQARSVVRRRALGVVAAFTPWNTPLFFAAWKVAPALRAGNVVVLKPSEHTPLATRHLAELLTDTLPPGALEVLTGPAALDEVIATHPSVRMLSYTGFADHGRALHEAVAPLLSRSTLVLEGNDPAVVLPGADPAAVADGLFDAAFANNGQTGAAVKRAYVHRSVAAAVLERLADRARGAVVGPGAEPGTDLGPLTTSAQRDRVATLVDGARRGGATVVSGGAAIEGPGWFHPPTILATDDDRLAVVAEDQFGPVLPVLTFDDPDEAVRRANAHPGLTASVWGGDPVAAASVGDHLRFGTVWTDCHLPLGPHQPFGGTGVAGLGVENGRWAIESCTVAQVVRR